VNWTEGRKKGYITSTLRKGFTRWPAKYEALKQAMVGRKLNKKTGRMAAHYTCAMCHKHFVSTEIQIDHVAPVVDVKKGFVSWDVYIERLFCEASNLQVVCIPCHKKKSAVENKERKKK